MPNNYLEKTDLVNEILTKVGELKPLNRRSIDGRTPVYIINKLIEIKPASCLEIGTGDGYSTAIIALCLQHNQKGIIYTISPDEIIEAKRIIKKLALESYVRFIQGRSPEILPTTFGNFAYVPFEFVFIDGNHELGAPSLDFCYASQYVNSSNCFYLFHDACYPPVKDSLGLIEKHYKLKVEFPFEDVGVIDLIKKL